MRVNLQYSIELEEIFEELDQHLRRRLNVDELEQHMRSISESLQGESPRRARAYIQEAREALFNLDTGLSEIYAMLEGYDNITQNNTTNTEETNEQLSEANESGEGRTELQPD
jgi:hypothetical protein